MKIVSSVSIYVLELVPLKNSDKLGKRVSPTHLNFERDLFFVNLMVCSFDVFDPIDWGNIQPLGIMHTLNFNNLFIFSFQYLQRSSGIFDLLLVKQIISALWFLCLKHFCVCLSHRCLPKSWESLHPHAINHFLYNFDRQCWVYSQMSFFLFFSLKWYFSFEEICNCDYKMRS